MVNMQMSKKEATEQAKPMSAADAPRYPYGLSITLDDDALSKLGVDKMPKVGGKMTIEARVTVTACSESDRQGGGKSRRCELQITDLELGGGPAKKGSAEDKMYGAKE